MTSKASCCSNCQGDQYSMTKAPWVCAVTHLRMSRSVAGTASAVFSLTATS